MRLVQRLAETLIPAPARVQPRRLVSGEFHGRSMSTAEDFAIVEWRPSERDLNGLSARRAFCAFASKSQGESPGEELDLLRKSSTSPGLSPWLLLAGQPLDDRGERLHHVVGDGDVRNAQALPTGEELLADLVYRARQHEERSRLDELV